MGWTKDMGILTSGTSIEVIQEEKKLEPVPKETVCLKPKETITTKEIPKNQPYFGAPLKWENIIALVFVHAYGIYGLSQFKFTVKYILTILWYIAVGYTAGIGVTAGAHRLWSHKSYKASVPLQIFYMICFSMAGQNPLFDWVRDHRVHHRFSETPADPHNAGRGFFFSHIGWLMMKKHPDVIRRGKEVDMTDITSNPVIVFEKKYFLPLKAFFCFFLPLLVPVYCWNDSWSNAFSANMVRYVLNLNVTWSVNSFAHLWGVRPYDKRIGPVENKVVSALAMGEGWHNYHHVFPWDYRAAELFRTSASTNWINFCAKKGWAYDLRVPSLDLVKKVAQKHGDGTLSHWGHDEVPYPCEEDPELKPSLKVL